MEMSWQSLHEQTNDAQKVCADGVWIAHGQRRDLITKSTSLRDSDERTVGFIWQTAAAAAIDDAVIGYDLA